MDNVKQLLRSVKDIQQWPMQTHLDVLLDVEPSVYRKCMQLLDVRYFTLALIKKHHLTHPSLLKHLQYNMQYNMRSTKTLTGVAKHPCLLLSSHYKLVEQICVQLSGKQLLSTALQHMPHMPHPERLFGPLLAELQSDNEQLVETLEALVHLMMHKNLEVGDFYSKVYKLLPHIIHSTRGLELIETLLSSIQISRIHLRNYFKLLSTLAILVPPSTSSKLAVLLSTLVRKHSDALWPLLQDSKTHSGTYSIDALDTCQCVEFKALQNHYNADISGLYDIFSQPWIHSSHPSSKKRAYWDLDDVQGIDYSLQDMARMLKKDHARDELLPPVLVEMDGRTMKQAPALFAKHH